MACLTVVAQLLDLDSDSCPEDRCFHPLRSWTLHLGGRRVVFPEIGHGVMARLRFCPAKVSPPPQWRGRPCTGGRYGCVMACFC